MRSKSRTYSSPSFSITLRERSLVTMVNETISLEAAALEAPVERGPGRLDREPLAPTRPPHRPADLDDWLAVDLGRVEADQPDQLVAGALAPGPPAEPALALLALPGREHLVELRRGARPTVAPLARGEVPRQHVGIGELSGYELEVPPAVGHLGLEPLADRGAQSGQKSSWRSVPASSRLVENSRSSTSESVSLWTE